jgi:hypothetical protein
LVGSMLRCDGGDRRVLRIGEFVLCGVFVWGYWWSVEYWVQFSGFRLRRAGCAVKLVEASCASHPAFSGAAAVFVFYVLGRWARRGRRRC